MRVRGRVWKYGDNVNTDVIFPGKYTYTVTEPQEMARHALEDLDPGFVENVRPGDVIVAGRNWGCGSSREQAVTALKWAGVGAIIAESFARIYYRNALNNGLLAFICPQAVQTVQTGDEVEIDLEAGHIRTPAGEFAFPPLPEVIPAAMEVLEATGLAFEWVELEAGWDCFQRRGTALPPETLEAVRGCQATLFGAVSSPSSPAPGYRSPIVALRQELDLFANLRPVRSLPGTRPNVDLLIVRENTEGLYAGKETSDGETAIAQRVITRRASERIVHLACQQAMARHRRLTLVHKANILRLT